MPVTAVSVLKASLPVGLKRLLKPLLAPVRRHPICEDELDAFVAESDRLGGPGSPACEAFWRNRVYVPTLRFDRSLDPFGEAYVTEQLQLYREISGRDFDQPVNEIATVDVDSHAAAANPYAHWPPERFAFHVERLASAFKLTAPPAGGAMLDMGCGWGLSSELAAYCGLTVSAVDINPKFVALVNRRAHRLGLALDATQGAFDSFETDRRFDIVFFYECFHHALRPWTLARRMASLLKPGGALVLCGEPVNDIWTHWGLRLDPLSIYCLRKFGWFESGWSLRFLLACLERAGLAPAVHRHPDPDTGVLVIGRKPG